MDLFKKNKTLGGVVILTVFIVLGFLFYSWSGSSSAPLTSSDSSNQMGQELLITLAGLNTIRLDGSIFTDPVFASLTDFGVIIPPEPAGRRNPFLPVGK